LFQDILAFLFFGFIFSVKKIRKKENLQNNKYNDKFNNYYGPYASSPPRHAAEAVIVKPENPGK